jgi:hypothetical protein
MYARYNTSFPPLLEEIFWDSVPESFVEGTIDVIRDAYTEVYDDLHISKSRSQQSIRDIFGQDLRIAVEDKLVSFGKEYNVRSEQCDNSRRSSSHAEVQFGNVVITTHLVSEEFQIVRQAKYRNSLSNGQMELFTEDSTKDSQEALVYAMFLYGPSQVSAPDFTSLVFPDRTCKKYLEKIRILSKYGRIMSKSIQEPQTSVRNHNEEIISDPSVELKIKKDVG